MTQLIVRSVLNKMDSRNRQQPQLKDYDKTTVMMDLLVLLETGVKMRWEELLNAPVFDFMHDINGINQHLNRNTYKLEDCFWPRYAK